VATSSTREKMIETAVRLFQQHGYHATSWRELVAAAGTPWGSAHHHFPGGKEQLGIAAIEAGAQATAAGIVEAALENPKPGSAVRAWCRAYAGQLAASDFREGCAIAAVALDTSGTSDALRDACRNAFSLWTELLATRFVAAGATRKRSRELATLIVLTVEGALLLARVSRSQAPLLLAGDQLATLLETELAHK
jgi:TetR/AcrR family transcriptional repressor of lmrAB and yxaGH operons